MAGWNGKRLRHNELLWAKLSSTAASQRLNKQALGSRGSKPLIYRPLWGEDHWLLIEGWRSGVVKDRGGHQVWDYKCPLSHHYRLSAVYFCRVSLRSQIILVFFWLIAQAESSFKPAVSQTPLWKYFLIYITFLGFSVFSVCQSPVHPNPRSAFFIPLTVWTSSSSPPQVPPSPAGSRRAM